MALFVIKQRPVPVYDKIDGANCLNENVKKNFQK